MTVKTAPRIPDMAFYGRAHRGEHYSGDVAFILVLNKGGVEGRYLLDEDTNRPYVGYDVMHVYHQDMFYFIQA